MMFIGHHCGFEAYLRLKQNPRYQSYLQVLTAKMTVMYIFNDNVKIKFKCSCSLQGCAPLRAVFPKKNVQRRQSESAKDAGGRWL